MSGDGVKDRGDRRSIIDNEIKASKRVELVHYRGKMDERPVARLPIDLPIYRMKNGRTQVEQYQYIEETGQPEDFFDNGEENASAQQAQHKILLKLSKDEKGPIYQELERVAAQRETLLMTADGVVLNGNRRLAAMSDLYGRDPKTYTSFSHVDALILPPGANEKDLELLEAELQMASETKLEYGWVERRLKLRRHSEVLNFPRKQIKETYRFRREEDINIEIHQLELAEEYLDNYRGKPHAYREVAKSEQLFKNLEKEVRGKSGVEAELRRLVGFLLAKEARNLGDRVYRYNPIFGRDFSMVLERFAEDEGIDLTSKDDDKPADDGTDDDDDPLSGLGGDEPSPFEPLKSILEDQSKTKETAEKLSSVYESLRQETKEEDVRQAALKNAQEANRRLHDVDLSTSEPATHRRIIAQLDAIISISETLRDQLENWSSKAPGAS